MYRVYAKVIEDGKSGYFNRVEEFDVDTEEEALSEFKKLDLDVFSIYSVVKVKK